MSSHKPLPPEPDALDPVAAYLDDSETSESAVHRVWRGVDQRLAPQLPLRRRFPIRLAAGAALAAAVVLAFVVWPDQDAPIALGTGGAFVATEVSTDAREIVLDDRSVLHVSPGARVVPIQNDARSLSIRVEGGQVRFEVEPGGPREWNVRTGLFNVRVVGTVFVVEDGEAGGAVRVERGEVLVTEIATGDRIELGAGEERRFARAVDSVTPSTTASSIDPDTADTLADPQPPARAELPGTRAPTVPAPDWRELARSGELDEAYEALGETIPEPGSDLLLAVDLARRTGHEARAVAMLETILRDHAQSDEAALAAITLGRIQRRRRNYAAALSAFERARAIGVPASFADEVCAERALARHESGDRAGARQIAGECLGLNGSSVYASRLRPLLRAE